MNKKEKKIIIECIKEIHADDGDYFGAIAKLCKLVGYEYPVYEAMLKSKPVDVCDLANKAESDFIVKDKRGDENGINK